MIGVTVVRQWTPLRSSWMSLRREEGGLSAIITMSTMSTYQQT